MKEKWYIANQSYNCNHITAAKFFFKPFKSISLYHFFFFYCLTVLFKSKLIPLPLLFVALSTIFFKLSNQITGKAEIFFAKVKLKISNIQGEIIGWRLWCDEDIENKMIPCGSWDPQLSVVLWYPPENENFVEKNQKKDFKLISGRIHISPHQYQNTLRPLVLGELALVI